MYLITFDLDTRKLGATSVYGEARELLEELGFEHIQESVYLLKKDNERIVQKAIDGLRDLAGFRKFVKDIQLFGVVRSCNLTEEIRGDTDSESYVW